MDRDEAAAVLRLAIGRLFRLASRPAQLDDALEYGKLRAAALDAADALSISTTDHRPSIDRDLRGRRWEDT